MIPVRRSRARFAHLRPLGFVTSSGRRPRSRGVGQHRRGGRSRAVSRGAARPVRKLERRQSGCCVAASRSAGRVGFVTPRRRPPRGRAGPDRRAGALQPEGRRRVGSTRAAGTDPRQGRDAVPRRRRRSLSLNQRVALRPALGEQPARCRSGRRRSRLGHPVTVLSRTGFADPHQRPEGSHAGALAPPHPQHATAPRLLTAGRAGPRGVAEMAPQTMRKCELRRGPRHRQKRCVVAEPLVAGSGSVRCQPNGSRCPTWSPAIARCNCSS